MYNNDNNSNNDTNKHNSNDDNNNNNNALHNIKYTGICGGRGDARGPWQAPSSRPPRPIREVGM